MKETIKYIFILLAPVMLMACHDKPEADPKPYIAYKTIFMYMPFTGSGGNSLYECFQENIRDCERAIKSNHGLGDNRMLLLIYQKPSLAHLIEFKYNSGAVVKDTLETIEEMVPTTASGLAKVLNKVKEIAPADNYAMMVGAHGEGWLPVSNQAKRITRYFGGDNDVYRTTVARVAEALKMTDTYLQFLLFDDCYMSTVENVYEMRDVSDVYIASTSEIMGYGMPYDKVLPCLLKKNPDYTTLNQEFHDFYMKYSDPYGTLGIIDCKYITDLADFMADINDNYTLSAEKLLQIQDLDVAHWEPTVYFDFYDYVMKLTNGDEAVKKRLDDIMVNLVMEKSHTPQIASFKSMQWRYTTINTFCGITCSDPSVNAVASETKKDTEWWKATHRQ